MIQFIFLLLYLMIMVSFFIIYIVKIWLKINETNNHLPNYTFSQYCNQLNANNLSDYLKKNTTYTTNPKKQISSNEINIDNVFKDPFLYFAATNAKFFRDYKILNVDNKKDYSMLSPLILPHPPIIMTAFTIPYRSIVFNKNYKLNQADISSYIGKAKINDNENDNDDDDVVVATATATDDNDNDDSQILPVTINCTNRPPVASVVLFGYQQNTRDDITEMLMCDCRDHCQLLRIPPSSSASSDNIEVNVDHTPSLHFPFPGLDPLISEPSTVIAATETKHPIMGSTLVNRPVNLLLDLNGPCTGLPDGTYGVVDTIDDDNVRNSPLVNGASDDTPKYGSQILREDLNFYLNTNPVKSQTLWMGGPLVGGHIAPSKVNCKFGVPFRLE
uniref:Wsv325-like protein n=1 Tax=Melicertus latisulcatus majanivirus TaxID=2984277 RepID=A0A9C7BHT2_9VIRU|nr:MAG: wsv325-like protein [Melicertus latisulcatus majanivirus]